MPNRWIFDQTYRDEFYHDQLFRIQTPPPPQQHRGMSIMTSYGHLRNMIRLTMSRRTQPQTYPDDHNVFSPWPNALLKLLSDMTNGDVRRVEKFLSRVYHTEMRITVCDHCSVWFPRSLQYTVEGGETVCGSCLTDENYRYSDRQECWVHPDEWDDDYHNWDRDDDDDDHERILDEYDWNVLNTYNEFKRASNEQPDPKRKGLYLGVELEMEGIDSVRAVRDILKEHKFGIVKRDGSLDYGYEVNTVPASMAYHTGSESPWRAMLKAALAGGSRSYNTSTCGLHIHASRRALSILTIGKTVVFVNCDHNANFMRAIAGRGLREHEYCATNPNKKITSVMGEGKYEAVNLCHHATIEFRIFKGTLKYSSVMRCIEFVHALLNYVPTVGYRNLGHEDFCKWVEKRGRKQYPHLLAWLLAKGYLPKRKPAPLVLTSPPTTEEADDEKLAA